MSRKERRRLVVLSRVAERGMSLRDGAQVLGVSYRQARRIYRRYREEGDVGIVHRSRGGNSMRAYPDEFKAAVLTRYQLKYHGFGPTLAAEKLALEGLALDHETLRRWLLSAGLIERRRKHGPHRLRRPRRERFGELVQLDGSHHAWFEERRGPCCLMNMVDDATGTTEGLMAEGETTEAAMRALWGWIDRYGIPEALYTDKDSIFVTNREATVEEELLGDPPLTAFGKACEKLGIRIITAHSPQAKGRVERSNGLYQDRFVKELRLLGASTIEEANQVLAGGFTAELNAKFALPPAREGDRHVPTDGFDLAEIFCFEDTRVVGNDYTLRYKNRIFQIEKQPGAPRPRQRVLTQRRLDGSIRVLFDGRSLTYTEVAPQPKPEIAEEPAPIPLSEASRPRCEPGKARLVAKDHPWNKANSRLFDELRTAAARGQF